MKQKFLFAVLLAIAATTLALSSCSNDDNAVDGDDEVYIEDGEGLADPAVASDEKIALPVAIVGQMPDNLQSAFDIRFTNVTGEISDNLNVVVIAQNQIATNTDKLLAVYEAGGIIVVVNPDDVQLKVWCDDNGVLYAGDGGCDNGADHHLLYAFNRNANFYFLDDFIHDDDEDNCNITLDSFVSWINKYANQENAKNVSFSNETSSTSYDIKKLFACQTIDHTYQMCLENKTLAHVVASKADKLTRNGEIDVSYSIYPLYSYKANGSSSGDYYIVEATVTIHNDDMYNGKWTKKHGGVKSHLCGFYLKKFELSNTLCQTDRTTLSGVKFPSSGTPVPETTIGATNYTSGFEWGIGGALSFGVQGGIKEGVPEITGQGSFTLNANFNWSNSESRSVSDLTINKNCPNGKVGYVFNINNTPHTKNAYKHLTVPSIASNDCDLHQTWIWHVPSTADNDTTNFLMCVWVKPTYESYHWYSSASDFSTSSWDDAVPAGDQKFFVKLVRPSRVPKGTLELTNTKSGQAYMTDIKIWEKSSNTSNAPDYTISGSFNGKAATIELPTGEYKVQVKLGASATSLKTYHSSNPIKIDLAEKTSTDAGFEFVEGDL